MKAPRASVAPPRHDAAWIADCLNRADTILAAPPRSRSPRAVPVGRRLARFVLPLELCKTTNFTRHEKPWILGRLKRDVLTLLLVQARGRRREPLPGRPFVRCVRFSSVEPDRFADWGKVAVDKLTGKNEGLGFLRDDRNQDVDVHQGWEWAAASQGFCLIEVWSGDEAAVVVPARKRAGKGRAA